MVDSAQSPVETVKDFGSNPGAVVTRWKEEIRLYDKEYDNWTKAAKKIIERYRDERNADDNTRRLNILWSNVQTLKPAVYGNTPKPEVMRRFKDRDPIGRVAAELLERASSYCVDAYGFDDMMDQVVEDRILVGRGVSWVRYIPIEGSPQTGPDGESFTPIDYEETRADHINWEDFGHTVARKWEEVTAVWKKEYLSRDQLVKRFGKIGKVVPLNHKPKRMDEDDLAKTGEIFKKAVVYEIWDKENREALWICPDYPDAPLDVRDDPLGLKDFFPCPKPLYATTTNNSLVPVPDYRQYQDQAREIDDLTARIDLLVSALAVAGVYDGSQEGIGKLLDLAKNGENTLIPVDTWAVLADKGGLKGVVDWLPIEQIIVVLTGLYEARAKAKEELFEVSGLADIVRGQVDPREKLGQSQIKGQFATLRLDDIRDEVARFARDVIRLKAEIISEHFSPETLSIMTNLPDMPQPPEPPMMGDEEGLQRFLVEKQKFEVDAAKARQEFMAAAQLLKNDALRSFRIDIETDSTIKLDEQQEKETRVEFLTAASGFLERAVGAIQLMPSAAPLLGEMLLFGIRGFKAGRQLEDTFEEAVDSLAEQPAPQADPMQGEMAKMQAQMQLEQMKLQADGEKSQAELGMKQQDMQAKIALEQAKLQSMQQIEAAKLAAMKEIEAAKLAMERAKVGVDMGFREKEMAFNQANDERSKSVQQEASSLADQIKALQEVAKQIAEASEGLPERVEALESILTAPKSISIERDKSGGIVGGVVSQGGVETRISLSHDKSGKISKGTTTVQ